MKIYFHYDETPSHSFIGVARCFFLYIDSMFMGIEQQIINNLAIHNVYLVTVVYNSVVRSFDYLDDWYY